MILRIILLCQIILFSCGTPANNKSTSGNIDQNCVDHIYAIDSAAGKVRNHACEKVSLSQSIVDYVGKIKRFNYRGCPKKFQALFLSHAESWEACLPITDQYPDIRGEMHDLFAIIENGEDGPAFKTLVQGIWDTWADLDRAYPASDKD